MSNTVRFAVNTSGKDKKWNYESLAANFQDKEGTLADVVEHVTQGHALCAGLLGGQRRKKINVIGSQWLLLDIDNSEIWSDEDGNPLDEQGRPIKKGQQFVDIDGNPIKKSDGRNAHKTYKAELTLEQALENSFVQQHCALIYTTASHTSEWHRFRMVFLLPEFIESIDEIEAMVKLLHRYFPHDPSCKDASRVFYGNSQTEILLFNSDAVLPSDWLDTAIAMADAEKAERERRLIEQQKKREYYQNNNDEDRTNELVEQALLCIPPRQPGSKNYDECRTVLMALHHHYGADEATRIAERWSPSIKGDTWQVARKMKSFNNRGNGRGAITLGSLFRIAQEYGFKMPQKEVNRATEFHRPIDEPKTFQESQESVVSQENGYQALRRAIAGCLALQDPCEREWMYHRIKDEFKVSMSLVRSVVTNLTMVRQGSSSQLMTLGDIASRSKGVKFLIPRFLPEVGLVCLGGYSKDGKSLLMYEMVHALIKGEPFLGYKPARKAKVLLIQAEEPESTIERRIRYGKYLEPDDPDVQQNLRVVRNWTITDSVQLEQWVTEFQPDVVVIDSFRATNQATGINENSPEAVSAIYQTQRIIHNHECAGLMVHHTTKNKEAVGIERLGGSSGIPGACDDVIMMVKASTDADNPGRFLSLSGRVLTGRFKVEIVQDEMDAFHWDCEGEVGFSAADKSLQDRIIQVIKLNERFHPDGMSVGFIREALELQKDDRSVYKPLKHLVDTSVLECRRLPSDKRVSLYSLPSKQKDEQFPETHTGQEENYSPDIHPTANQVNNTSSLANGELQKNTHHPETQKQDLETGNSPQDDCSSPGDEYLVNNANAQLVKVPERYSSNTPWGRGKDHDAKISDKGGVAVYPMNAAPRLPKRNPSLFSDGRALPYTSQLEKPSVNPVETVSTPQPFQVGDVLVCTLPRHRKYESEIRENKEAPVDQVCEVLSIEPGFGGYWMIRVRVESGEEFESPADYFEKVSK